MSIPYNNENLRQGAYQVWHSESYKFILENRIDLTPYIDSPNWLSAPTDDIFNILPLSFYPLPNGMLAVKGTLQYIGPPIVGSIDTLPICFLSNFPDKSFFNLYSYSGNIFPVSRLLLSTPPNDVDNSWSASISFGAQGTSDPVQLFLYPNNLGTSGIDTNDRVYINMLYFPYQDRNNS